MRGPQGQGDANVVAGTSRLELTADWAANCDLHVLCLCRSYASVTERNYAGLDGSIVTTGSVGSNEECTTQTAVSPVLLLLGPLVSRTVCATPETTPEDRSQATVGEVQRIDATRPDPLLQVGPL